MSPLAIEPRDQLFRAMLALSVGFHVALFLGFVFWTGLSKPPPRFIHVTVVDLVAGPPGPEPRPAAPERGSAREKPPVASRARAAKERVAAKAAPPPRTASARMAPAAPKARPADTKELSDRIRKMREEKASEENVREALKMLRNQREQQEAVRGVRERVARRVDMSTLPSPPARVPPPSAGGAGGGGATTGESPERLRYARALWEKIYESWVPPVSGGGHSRPALVSIKIEKDGKATNMKIEESSGNRFFDDSVLRAIRKASPLPLPPGKLREDEELYDVVIKFSEPPKGAR